MKIVFLDASTVGDTPLDEIAALGELVCYPASTKEEALERVKDCEVLIINKIIVDAALIAAAPSLKLICEAQPLEDGTLAPERWNTYSRLEKENNWSKIRKNEMMMNAAMERRKLN